MKTVLVKSFHISLSNCAPQANRNNAIKVQELELCNQPSEIVKLPFQLIRG